jgi:hypothetical protein
VYARRSGLLTDYLVAWSDRPMPRQVLEPAQSGDAPGADPRDVPRPPYSQRSFSFSEPKAGYQLAMYQVSERPEAALRGAASRLSGEGWVEDTQFALAADKRHKLVARFSKDRRDVVVMARAARGAGTQLGYLTRDL